MAAITREQKIREHYAEAGFSAEQALALADGATATRDWHREDMDNLAAKDREPPQRSALVDDNHVVRDHSVHWRVRHVTWDSHHLTRMVATLTR